MILLLHYKLGSSLSLDRNTNLSFLQNSWWSKCSAYGLVCKLAANLGAVSRLDDFWSWSPKSYFSIYAGKVFRNWLSTFPITLYKWLACNIVHVSVAYIGPCPSWSSLAFQWPLGKLSGPSSWVSEFMALHGQLFASNQDRWSHEVKRRGSTLAPWVSQHLVLVALPLSFISPSLQWGHCPTWVFIQLLCWCHSLRHS